MRIIYTLQYLSLLPGGMGVVYSKILYFQKPKIIQTLSRSFAVSIYHYSNKFIYFKFNVGKKIFGNLCRSIN